MLAAVWGERKMFTAQINTRRSVSQSGNPVLNCLNCSWENPAQGFDFVAQHSWLCVFEGDFEFAAADPASRDRAPVAVGSPLRTQL
jgi:hypothetical protein